MAYLKEIKFNWTGANNEVYPFSIEAIKNTQSIITNHNVTFFIGENGSGKSTLLEAIAHKCGFSIKGGSKDNISDEENDNLSLSSIITLSWCPKISNGFFFRAETFYNFASYIDNIPESLINYGGKSLHSQSHGESFMALFQNRFGGKAIYILDEPESALSPQRQLAFLRTIYELEQKNVQFIIATHSPILMAYPNAEIYSFSTDGIQSVSYEDTENYQLTKYFLNNTEKFLKNLFED